MRRSGIGSRTAAKRRAILLLGAGKMGGALLKGWLAKGLGPVTVIEPAPSREIRRLAAARRIALKSDIDDIVAARVATCVVAVKPQILRREAGRLKPLAESGALIISIAAGARIANLARACGGRARIVRAMPNLPGAVGLGISALHASRKATRADRARAAGLLRPLGDVVWVPKESMIDTVTAVSGSGPAYVFLLVEALAQAAEAEGLSRALSERLARATITGAGGLLTADVRPAEKLRRDVTSPGGTTEAALGILMREDALAALIRKAVEAARRRAQELSA